MSEPQLERTAMIARRTRDALRMDPRIPLKKVWKMIVRCAIGTPVGLIGLWLLVETVRGYRATNVLSIALLGVAVGFLLVGVRVVAGQMLVRAILSFKEPVRVARVLWKGAGTDASPRQDGEADDE